MCVLYACMYFNVPQNIINSPLWHSYDISPVPDCMVERQESYIHWPCNQQLTESPWNIISTTRYNILRNSGSVFISFIVRLEILLDSFTPINPKGRHWNL